VNSFDFSALPRPVGYRASYTDTLETFRRGLLSHGFVWEMAKHDEVFAAFLRKNGVEPT